jgi:PAS domain-containing protein
MIKLSDMNTYRIEDTTKLLDENDLLKRRLVEYEARIALLTGEVEAGQSAGEPEALEAARLRMLLDNLPQLVWTALPNGLIDYFNKRWYAYTGQTPGEAENLGWQAAQHPNDQLIPANCISM